MAKEDILAAFSSSLNLFQTYCFKGSLSYIQDQQLTEREYDRYHFMFAKVPKVKRNNYFHLLASYSEFFPHFAQSRIEELARVLSKSKNKSYQHQLNFLKKYVSLHQAALKLNAEKRKCNEEGLIFDTRSISIENQTENQENREITEVKKKNEDATKNEKVKSIDIEKNERHVSCIEDREKTEEENIRESDISGEIKPKNEKAVIEPEKIIVFDVKEATETENIANEVSPISSFDTRIGENEIAQIIFDVKEAEENESTKQNVAKNMRARKDIPNKGKAKFEETHGIAIENKENENLKNQNKAAISKKDQPISTNEKLTNPTTTKRKPRAKRRNYYYKDEEECLVCFCVLKDQHYYCDECLLEFF